VRERLGGDVLMSDEGEREGMREHSAGSLFFLEEVHIIFCGDVLCVDLRWFLLGDLRGCLACWSCVFYCF